MMRYSQYLIDARRDEISRYRNTVTELNSIEPKIRHRKAELQSQQSSLLRQRQQLQKDQRRRAKVIAELDRVLADKDSQLQRQEADRKQLEKLLNDLQLAIAKLSIPDGDQPLQQRKGKLHWPLKGRVQSKYGSLRAGNKLRWDGMVIATSAGTPVKSVHHGRVLFADYLGGMGLLIIVDHGNGYWSLYGHNQSLLRQEGDWVGTGEHIANAGNSGGLSNASLYFALRQQGKPINPHPWLQT